MRIACVDVPFDRGSLGHSDGDVAAHAVCDALLGALALGDIGKHFPPGDERWKRADSRVFLARTVGLLRQAGARVVNVDVTIMLERPRLAPHVAAMREALARTLGCEVGCVSVKAKTGEGLDAVGRGEGVAARAVALVEVDG